MRQLLLISIAFIALTAARGQIPAFPGAEGWGATSVGGRGGVVIEVTNLNDSGPGSFRNACSTQGARTIVFRTGGVIDLLSEVQITNPYIYIAGQSAPGDGIVLKNFALTIFTHDVTIRGMRIRAGNDFPNMSPDNRDCIDVELGSYNVIIDHCSFSWGSDENVSVWDSAVSNVTFQWCIISEGLYANIHPKGFHSMALLIGNGASKTSIHHNLFAHCAARTPLIKRQVDHEFVDNLVYDWIYGCELFEDGSQIKCDFTGNYYEPFTYNSYPELPLHLDFDSTTTLGSELYMPDNYFSGGTAFITATQLNSMGTGNAALFSSTSLLSIPSTITFDFPFAARDTVLAWAGALHPQRDITDIRVLTSVTDSTGGMLDCIGTDPILLDSGNVLGATDSTIIYTEAGKPYAYSTASRKIVITSGTGAGQVRYGIDDVPVVLDSVNEILEGKINTWWTTKPDSTSSYKFFAGCNNVLSSYPVYMPGLAPQDNDHDGMPDAWEITNGLNPNDASDHNGTTLDSTGYTNLEVYLNGFYSSTLNTVAENLSPTPALSISPNPFSTEAILYSGIPLHEATLMVYNSFGQKVKQIENISGYTFVLSRNNLAGGLYFVRLINDRNLISTKKILITN